MIRGVEISAPERTQHDHHSLSLNGQLIAVEAAAPTLTITASPELTITSDNIGTPSGVVGEIV